MYYSTLRYYQSITLDHTKVPSDVTDMSVILTGAFFCDQIKTSGGAYAAQSTGADLRFFTDELLTTPIPFDIIKWSLNATPANSLIEVVIKVSISSSTDTIIYVGWGDPNLAALASADTYGRYNAYKSGFAIWCSMKDDPGTSAVLDRTSNARSGTKRAAANPAQGTATPYIEEYESFVGSSSDYIDFASFNTGSQFIVFCPFNYTKGSAPLNDRIVSKKTTWNEATGFEITMSGASTTNLFCTGSGGFYIPTGVFVNIVTDGWETLAVRYNNTAIDVFSKTTKFGSGTITSVVNNAYVLTVGYNAAHNDSPITAYMDNFIVYLGTMTDGEIQAMQNNQMSPGTFVKTVGEMKVAFGVKFGESSVGTFIATPATLSYTMVAHSNRILLVGVEWEHSGITVSGVTYNGVAMTKIDQQDVGTTTQCSVAIYYMKESLLPAAGAYNIVVTLSANPTAGLIVRAITLYDASQNDYSATAKTSNLITDPISVDITTIEGTSMIVDIVGDGNAGTYTADADQTIVGQTSYLTTTSAMSLKSAITAGVTNNGWTFIVTSNRQVLLVVAIASFFLTDHIIGRGIIRGVGRGIM